MSTKIEKTIREQIEDALQEETAPCYTYFEKGHPIPDYDFDAMLTETSYHDNPKETVEKYTEIGAMELSKLLRDCNVSDAVGGKIMGGIGLFYAVPIFLSHLSQTIDLIGRASDDVRAKKLQPDELVLRLLLRLRCDRTEHKITAEEKKWIKVFAEGNQSISSVARITERSKSTISDIMNDVSHAYSGK